MFFDSWPFHHKGQKNWKNISLTNNDLVLSLNWSMCTNVPLHLTATSSMSFHFFWIFNPLHIAKPYLTEQWANCLNARTLPGFVKASNSWPQIPEFPPSRNKISTMNLFLNLLEKCKEKIGISRHYWQCIFNLQGMHRALYLICSDNQYDKPLSPLKQYQSGAWLSIKRCIFLWGVGKKGGFERVWGITPTPQMVAADKIYSTLSWCEQTQWQKNIRIKLKISVWS